jgi:hypothetical protein
MVTAAGLDIPPDPPQAGEVARHIACAAPCPRGTVSARTVLRGTVACCEALA